MMGFSDGGAHVGTICDASFPAYLLSYWTRDRADHRIPLVACGADADRRRRGLSGVVDRGRLKVGMRADINVIDYDRLTLKAPRMVKDLPAGGQSLLQDAQGFRATLVNGRQVIADDQVTDERPGTAGEV